MNEEPNAPLPTIANYVLRREKLDEYAFAMADVLCWLNGFIAAGGEYSPSSQNSLRELTEALKSIQGGHLRSSQSHD